MYFWGSLRPLLPVHKADTVSVMTWDIFGVRCCDSVRTDGALVLVGKSASRKEWREQHALCPSHCVLPSHPCNWEKNKSKSLWDLIDKGVKTINFSKLLQAEVPRLCHRKAFCGGCSCELNETSFWWTTDAAWKHDRTNYLVIFLKSNEMSLTPEGKQLTERWWSQMQGE